MPNCPQPFAPQQYAAPTVVTPQTKRPPVLSIAKAWFPLTAMGVRLQAPPRHTSGPVVSPIPNEPAELSPQQYAIPAPVIPHVTNAPALSEAKLRFPTTGVGSAR